MICEVLEVGKAEPLRKCLGCDEMIGKKGLLRIVKDKDGEISLDPTGKKNGRGAYICKSSACFEAARKRRAFERSLKCKIPEEIYVRLADEVKKAAEKSE